MDVKTMIYFLKPDGLMKDGNRVVLLADEIANEISDYIEQQEKCAELGRLAMGIKQLLCKYKFNSYGCNHTRDFVICGWIPFCQKRAELQKPECVHKWVNWEVKEDDICEKCGMCASEIQKAEV